MVSLDCQRICIRGRGSQAGFDRYTSARRCIERKRPNSGSRSQVTFQCLVTSQPHLISVYRYHSLTSTSPEIRRQTGALGQPSTPNFAKDHNSQELASYYDIDVSGSEVVLGIKITDDMPVNMRSVQRLLAIATNHYNEEVDRLGKDTILNGNCYYNSWPHLPGINTAITIQDKYFKLLTYGMVSDALRGVVQFYVAHPRQDGELTALIKIPRSVGSRPVELVIVGFVSLLQDDEPPISQNCSLYAARCMPPRESVRTPL